MKKEEKNTPKQPEVTNGDAWMFIVVILFLCTTAVFTTRMYVDGHLLDRMIDHYTLRGKDVIVKDQQLVFINDK